MKLAWLGWFAASAALAGCGSSSSGGGSPGAATGGDAGNDAAACDGGECPGPVTGLTANKWTWVDVPGAMCRDGSQTGFAVSLGTKTDKLMIFLEGGGACFNSTTCALTPESFDGASWVSGAAGTATGNSAGIFDRADANNPVKDWSFVYVPYCTGDIHAGNNPNGMVGSTAQKFVGYANIGLDLQRVVPTFPGLSQVLLTGISAGGFGAAANYIQVAKAFGSTPVTMLDDSGPAMEDPYLATCLQTDITSLWSLDQTVLADCGSDCNTSGKELLQYAQHLGTAYPSRSFGLIESTDDSVISEFFGFGVNNCASSLIPGTITAATFTAGLEDLRSKLSGEPNFGSFFFQGTQHTSLGISTGSGSFDDNSTTDTNTFADVVDGGADAAAPADTDAGASGDTDAASLADAATGTPADAAPQAAVDAGAPVAADAGTIKLITWVTNLINGQTANVGP